MDMIFFNGVLFISIIYKKPITDEAMGFHLFILIN